MKRLLLACCMLVTMHASFSQTIQLTNGGSTSLSGTTGAAPISAYFEFMRFQVVYTAAELNAAGITGPKTITQLGWYVATAPAGALPSYQIRMANTPLTNSAAHNTATLTTVYNSASYAPVAGGFDMLTLNGTFIWNGTDNLLVDVCYGAAVYAAPYGEVRTYAATTPSGSRRVRCDGCGSQCANNTTTTNTFKPQVSLTFTTPPSCLAPTGLSATAVTSSSATLNWGAVGGATGYEWAVTTSATPPASGTATTLTSVPSGVLSSNTLYYLHVRTNCGGPFSSWSTTSFTTLCNSTTVPYTENFDGVTAPAIPSCITVQNVNGSNTWGNYSTPAAIVIGAPNSMVYPYNSSVAADDWFFLQGLNLTAGTSYRLTFSWKSNPSFPESFEVMYGTAANAAAMTSGTLYTNTNAASSTVVVQTADFIPGANGTYYIGFHCNSAADQDFLAIDDVSVTLSPVCGNPTGLTAVVTGTGTTANLSWTAPGIGTPTGYEWDVTTSATPPASGTATALTTANATGLTAGLQYYLHVRTNCGAGGFSSWATFAFTTIINDAPCGAIPLTLGGPAECGNTALATSTGDPALFCSSPNNTLWYSYTPAANGTVLVVGQTPASGNPLNGWVQFYTATGTCPTLTLTQVNTSACTGEFGQNLNDSDTLTSPVLTGGTTYYIMVDGFSGDVGEFCIKLITPPPPPACTTNLLPANGATGVVISPAPAISWNASPGASSYDVFFGTVNPPLANIGNTTATTVNITGLSYNTTYYWYVRPVGVGGAATGCDVNTTSFTTENPTNCAPLYTTGCSLADSLTYFSLKGASGTVIYNPSGAICNTTPVAYSDYTAAFTPVTLVRGESFGGFMRTGDPNDYASIWIDSDDDGFFEDNERIMNNLRIGTTNKLYTLYVPTTTALGTHRMRVRVVYYGTAPTTPTHPCNSYTYGETEDYLVNITNVGSTHGVAPGLPGSCVVAGQIVIDAASNNNGASPVFLVDSLNNYVAAIYPNGNNLGTVTPEVYVHNGPVRQDVTGRYYLDRNINVTVTTQPVSPYNIRLYFRNSELNALIAQPGSGVTSIFDLLSTKSGIFCNPGYNGTGTLISPTGFGSMSGDRFLDFTNVTGFSSFYFHGGASVLLPIDLLSFAGQREGSVNKLRWTTASEQNNRGFDVQRSADGITYESIGFVNTLAPGGNSTGQLSYEFTDNTVGGRKLYYRLRQMDTDGRSKLSSVVLIKGDKPVTLAIDGLYPNPANTLVNVVVGAPVRDKVTLLVVDMTGKTVLQKVVNVEAGSNTVPFDISQLTGGSYLVKLVCSNCETAISKFVKQ